jgi:hypothetical protein
VSHRSDCYRRRITVAVARYRKGQVLRLRSALFAVQAEQRGRESATAWYKQKDVKEKSPPSGNNKQKRLVKVGILDANPTFTATCAHVVIESAIWKARCRNLDLIVRLILNAGHIRCILELLRVKGKRTKLSSNM